MDQGAQAHRFALVIGNGAYKSSPKLRNPANDATAIGQKLVALGYDVRTELDATAEQMFRAISEFTGRLAQVGDRGSTHAVLFYAGHGVQIDGENYLLPVDSEIRNKLDLRRSSVALDILLETLSGVARASVVMLDCCRDNPLPRTLGPSTRSAAASHGLANVQAPKGVYIAYATQPHFVALDGAGANSPFTEALVEFIDDPGKHVTDVLMDVRRKVYETTGGQQIPWDHSALFEPFRFAAGDVSKLEGLSDEARQRVLQEEAEMREESYWRVIPQTKDIAFIHSFVTQFPNSKHRAAALARIDALKASSEFRRSLRLVGAGLAALIVVYLVSIYARTTILPDTNIALGDIENESGGFGYNDSYYGCRIRCLAERFGKPCVAFTFDRSPLEKDEKESDRKRCFPKYDASFIWKPSQGGTPAAESEIMPTVFREKPEPKESRFFLLWYRGLVGEPIEPLEVAAVLKRSEPPFKTDIELKRTVWTLKPGECHQACIDLGGKCAGFSYTMTSSRCELFKSVKGIVRDNFNKAPVHFADSLSGCDDPGAVDPATGINECGGRRSRSPAAGLSALDPRTPG